MSSISSVSSSAALAVQVAAASNKPIAKTPAPSVPATPSVKTNDGDGDDAGGGINIIA
jgi:hypothetical protein